MTTCKAHKVHGQHKISAIGRGAPFSAAAAPGRRLCLLSRKRVVYNTEVHCKTDSSLGTYTRSPGTPHPHNTHAFPWEPHRMMTAERLVGGGRVQYNASNSIGSHHHIVRYYYGLRRFFRRRWTRAISWRMARRRTFPTVAIL